MFTFREKNYENGCSTLFTCTEIIKKKYSKIGVIDDSRKNVVRHFEFRRFEQALEFREVRRFFARKIFEK